MDFDEMQSGRPGESSETIRQRVVSARKVQEERFSDCKGVHCNAQMTSRLLSTHVRPTPEAMKILRDTMIRLNMSARAYDRILKVSRTIADLAGSPDILPEHMREAVSYRALDRSGWGKY